VSLKDVTGVFGREFIVGSFAPVFFIGIVVALRPCDADCPHERTQPGARAGRQAAGVVRLADAGRQ
jgi:hypothetical protein